jgi:tetrahydromethanopterin S-methyltransferase subunit B
MVKKDEDKELVASFSSSTVSDVEYDIIKELDTIVESMEKSLDESDTDGVRDKLPYLRHLINDLEEALSGDFENLRYRRFITKETL